MAKTDRTTSPVTAVPATRLRGRRASSLKRRQAKWGWLFIAPWIVGFLLFTLIPILATLGLSFSDFNIEKPDEVQFIGTANYERLSSDRLITTSLWVTVRYGMLAIPVTLAFSIFLAALVNSRNLAGKSIFRTLFYMPFQIPVVAGALVWEGVMNTETGWINLALEAIGIPGPDWMNSVVWIYPALTLIGLWGTGNMMLTLLAGMQGVPQELYDAARVDGASGFQQFFRITLPMISPVIFYNLILMIIGAFKYFDVAYVLKEGTGDPGMATLFYNLYLYKTAFPFNNMGYATAQAWLLFVIVLALTILLFVTQRRWVYYAGREE